MSSDQTDGLGPADFAELERICKAIVRRCEAGALDDIPDAAATSLLTAGTLLYAAAAHEHGRAIAPFADRDAVSATAVVVTTKGMLEAAGLSSFDLAMWSNRTPQRWPGGES